MGKPGHVSSGRFLPGLACVLITFILALTLSYPVIDTAVDDEETDSQEIPRAGCSARVSQLPVRAGHPTMPSTWRVASLRDGATVQLSSHHSTWWGFDGVNGSVVSCARDRPPTLFTVERAGEQSVRLRVPRGTYVAVSEDGHLVVDEASPTTLTEFTVIEVDAGVGPQIRLKSSGGVYVSGTDHGSLEVYARNGNTWESHYVYEVSQVESWRGVNLGGWLVIEPWMTPDLVGEDAPRGRPKVQLRETDDSETAMSSSSSEAKAQKLLRKHYRDFVSPSDFRFFRRNGLNCVRIPVGWWLSDGGGSLSEWEGLQEHIEVLDQAFDMAASVHIGVFLALHAGPDQANGLDSKEIMQRMLDTVDWMAARYSGKRNFLGISLLSENIVNHISMEALKEYYQKGYETVRRHSPCAYVAISPRYRGLTNDLKNFLGDSRYTNVILEIHAYMATNPNFKDRPPSESIEYVSHVKRAQIEELQASGRLVLVGEWSLGFNGNPQVPDEDTRRFAEVQVEVYGKATAGWFFWGHKIGRKGWEQWSFLESVGKGWLSKSIEGW